MSLSAGARPKRKSKKVLDPDFQYEFPSSAFLPDDLNLEEQSNPETYNRSTKLSTQSSKLKSAAVLAAFSSPIAIFSSSALSFDQQLQLLKLQKDKLELELKVLIISHQERFGFFDHDKILWYGVKGRNASSSRVTHHKSNSLFVG